jgi:hypothetical protein
MWQGTQRALHSQANELLATLPDNVATEL